MCWNKEWTLYLLTKDPSVVSCRLGPPNRHTLLPYGHSQVTEAVCTDFSAIISFLECKEEGLRMHSQRGGITR